MVPLWVQLTECALSWAARLINLPGDCLPRLVMFLQLVEGRQNCSRPTFRWSDMLKAVLRWADLPAYQWATEVQSEHWRTIIIRGYRDCESGDYELVHCLKVQLMSFMLHFVSLL